MTKARTPVHPGPSSLCLESAHPQAETNGAQT